MKLALTVRETLSFACLILESVKDIEREMPYTMQHRLYQFPIRKFLNSNYLAILYIEAITSVLESRIILMAATSIMLANSAPTIPSVILATAM